MVATVSSGSEMVTLTHIRKLVGQVVDPEIPALTIEDLGILRRVAQEGEKMVITITPTYSGCPAMGWIRSEIERVLEGAGIAEREVRISQYPVWTTDWMGPDARQKLAEVGIAPPGPRAEVRCPRCEAGAPRTVSQFGSTACKALLACMECGEPFHYFKEF
jgi:ring-1,2-phenylacetyl-CoA epoxidase subunit PaaD